MLNSIIKIAIIFLILAGVIYLFPVVYEWFSTIITKLAQEKWGVVLLIGCIIVALVD